MLDRLREADARVLVRERSGAAVELGNALFLAESPDGAGHGPRVLLRGERRGVLGHRRDERHPAAGKIHGP